MNRVVLACTPSNVYDFFLPIAANLWMNRIGFKPIILLVGTRKEWSDRISFQALQGQFEVEFVDRVDGVDDSNVCMSSRQHAAALESLSPMDTLLIGDVDLLPIRKDFYSSERRRPVKILHAGMYQDRYWPAYGPMMSVRDWRETMGIRLGDLRGSLMQSFADGKILDIIQAQKLNYMDSRLWTFDEQYASEKIRAAWGPDDLCKVDSFGYERLCRNSWPKRVYALNYIDAHCPRPGYTDENWPKIRELLAQIAPGDLSWFDGYATAYRNSMGLDLPKSGMPVKAEKSDFDSEIFGVRVGILRCFGDVPRNFSIREANRTDFDVVFVKAEGWQVPVDNVTALDYCLEMEVAPPLESRPPIAVSKRSMPSPSHAAIAKTAFPDSRFHRDPRLAGMVGSLYERWLCSSGVYVFDPVQDGAFMAASEDDDGAGRISLLAVLDKSRGVGIGETLVRGVIASFHERLWRVRVSCRNTRAIKFYEKIGFRAKSIHTSYHVWTSGEDR